MGNAVTLTKVLAHLMLFDTMFLPCNNACRLLPDNYVEPEMNTSPIVFRKLATLLSLPITSAVVATPADTDSTVIFRSGHAIGWSSVTRPNLGSISGWNHDCHAGLACRLAIVENKHGGGYLYKQYGSCEVLLQPLRPRLFQVNERRIMTVKDTGASSRN
jgi:hypothetical protein